MSPATGAGGCEEAEETEEAEAEAEELAVVQGWEWCAGADGQEEEAAPEEEEDEDGELRHVALPPGEAGGSSSPLPVGCTGRRGLYIRCGKTLLLSVVLATAHMQCGTVHQKQG